MCGLSLTQPYDLRDHMICGACSRAGCEGGMMMGVNYTQAEMPGSLAEWSHHRVLGTEPRSSGRAVNALNY